MSNMAPNTMMRMLKASSAPETVAPASHCSGMRQTNAARTVASAHPRGMTRFAGQLNPAIMTMTRRMGRDASNACMQVSSE